MNITIITSAIMDTSGYFSPQQRFEQTLNTIISIRKHIPSLIYVADISNLSNQYRKKLKECCDKLIICDNINNTGKSSGEKYILRYVLENHIPDNIEIIYKISGRYFLTEDFSLGKLKKDKYNFRPSTNCYHTTFYTIPFDKITNFIHILSICSGIDIEHALYNYLPKDEVNLLDLLNCRGFLSNGISYSS